MPRAIWTGTIGFGLVSVPVRLYPATRRKDIRFHEIDRLSGRRIRHQKVVEEPPALTLPSSATEGGRGSGPDLMPAPTLPSPASGGGRASERELRTVPMPDVLKGFEVAKDRYVTVAPEELEELAPERSRSIDVEQFVEASAIDPIYFDSSYYVVPERDHERAFGLLVDVMEETRKLAIGWFVLRRKRYLAALRTHGRLMILSTMFYADEVLPVEDLQPAAPADLRKKEHDMAVLLVNTLSGPFEPQRYPNEYRRRLAALIDGRAASARPAPSEVVAGNGFQDLMAALQASVEQARAARKRPQKTPKKKRKTA
jgi:DNA end-binding protein Ku